MGLPFEAQSFGPTVDSNAFERRGIIELNPLVPDELIDAIRHDMELGWIEYRRGHRVQDAWDRVPAVARLATWPPILESLQVLYCRKPRPFQTLNFRVGTEQAPHSDTIHFNSDPPGFMCGVWVALEDVDADNGPLVYYPGSHKLPEWTMQDVRAEPIAMNYHLYEQFIEWRIGLHGLTAEYGTIRRGQALVWASNLIHGGAPIRDRDRSRHSQVTHYFFDGDFQFWTPLVSGAQRHIRKPNWIAPPSSNGA